MMLVNGLPAESIPATDRGLAYGDGVFRTLRARHGEPLHWVRHHAKLAGDCAALGIACPDQTLLFAQHLDQVLVVIESEKTQIIDAKRLLRQLEACDTNVIGIVLNKTRTHLPRWSTLSSQ